MLLPTTSNADQGLKISCLNMKYEDETKVVFSKPIRQDPNRGMHFITNLTPINKGKLGSSRMFLKNTKVETYY